MKINYLQLLKIVSYRVKYIFDKLLNFKHHKKIIIFLLFLFFNQFFLLEIHRVFLDHYNTLFVDYSSYAKYDSSVISYNSNVNLLIDTFCNTLNQGLNFNKINNTSNFDIEKALFLFSNSFDSNNNFEFEGLYILD